MTDTLATPALFELAPFDREALRREAATICALTPELRIAYVNEAWTRFALTNGALDGSRKSGNRQAGDGRNPARASSVPRAAVRARSDDTVRGGYDCSSATTPRRFRMRVLPCERGGFLVVHSLLRVAPNERDTWDWVPAYVEGPPPSTSHGLCPPCAADYYSDAAPLRQ